MLKKTTPARPGASAAPRPHPRKPLDAAREADPGGLVERALWLDALDTRLRQTLPPELASQCRLGNVRDGALVFLVGSPVWKARLRLHAPAILAAAHALDLPARELAVKISAMPAAPRTPAPPRPLSDHARASLRSAAESIKDPGLRQTLLDLASVP